MISPVLLSAQQSWPNEPLAPDLSLRGAVEIALSKNPNLQANASRVQSAQGRAYQAKLWSNPELELSVEEWPTDEKHGFSDSKRTLGVVQELPFPGKKSLDKKLGGAEVSLYEAQLAIHRLELERDVKAAYAQVLAVEQFVATSEELVEVAQSSAKAVGQSVEAGATSDQELLRAEIQLDQAKGRLADFQRDWLNVRQTLATVLGVQDLHEVRLTGVLTDSAQPELLRQESQQWLTSHPSLIAARTSRTYAELALRRAGLDPYPNVKVGAAGGRIGESDESIVEFRVSLPLPIIDRAKGRKMEAQGNLEAAQAELTRTELALARDWRRAQQRYRTALEQVTRYRDRIVPKSNRALELVQGGFAEGKFGLNDLLDTQRTNAEVRLDYHRKLLELNIAQAELEALIAIAPFNE